MTKQFHLSKSKMILNLCFCFFLAWSSPSLRSFHAFKIFQLSSSSDGFHGDVLRLVEFQNIYNNITRSVVAISIMPRNIVIVFGNPNYQGDINSTNKGNSEVHPKGGHEVIIILMKLPLLFQSLSTKISLTFCIYLGIFYFSIPSWSFH